MDGRDSIRCATFANETGRDSPTTSALLRASVVVPVFERSGVLAALLDALSAQSFSGMCFEVVVCDDGSSRAESGAIESLVMRAREEHDLSVTYLWQPHSGAGAARNLGLAEARGELVVFTDSDCLPQRDWLSRLSAAFDDPTIGLAGGPAEYRGAATFGGRCVNFLMATTIGAGGARDPRSSLHVKYYPRSYNLAVRREHALAAGGFPPAIYGEDIEFSQRVAALGPGVAFVPEAVVVHDERRSSGATIAQSFAKGCKRLETTRRCGMHNVLYAAPAALVAIVLLVAILAVAGSPFAPWACAPLVVYFCLILALGVYGSFAMREPAAVFALPYYTALMHTAYGLGYWWGLARMAAGRSRQAACGSGQTRIPDDAPISRDVSHRKASDSRLPVASLTEHGGG